MINNTLNIFLIIKLCYSNVLSNATAILNMKICTSVNGVKCSFCQPNELHIAYEGH